MFNNKIVNIIFSILVALGLWIFVVGEINPETAQKFGDIEVRFINSAVLAEDDLAIVDPGVVTVDLTIVGTRSDMKSLSSDELDVTADLSGLSKGENYIKLKVALPEDMSLQKISANNIRVTVEDLISAEKPVVISYEGEMPQNQEPGGVILAPATVLVSGASSSVESVTSLEAVVQLDQLDAGQVTVESPLTPVNGNQEPIFYLSLSQKSVQVTMTLFQRKTVALEVPLTGTLPEGFVLDSKNQPATLVIKGTEEALADIDKITGVPVDISRLTESVNLPIQVVLPKGIEIAWASENPVLELEITPIKTGSFTYESSSLTLSGLDPGLTANVPTQNIKLSVSAPASVIAELASGDFSLEMDLSGLGVGTHQVAVKVQTELENVDYSLTPEQIEITISEE